MRKYYILLLIMATLTGSCGAKTADGSNSGEAETEVLFKTNVGDFRVKLYNETPEHKNNFIKLVQENMYDSLLFHRVIRNFMVQGGDPESKNAPKGERLGAGDLGYTLPAEFIFPKYYHKRGALSAARQADQVNPDRRSSASQFYVVTGKKYSESELHDMARQLNQQERQNLFNNLCTERRDEIIRMQRENDEAGLTRLEKELNQQLDSITSKTGPFKFTQEQISTYTTIGGAPFLDNQYTVFGEVVEGMETIEKIEKARTDRNDRPVDDIIILSASIVE